MADDSINEPPEAHDGDARRQELHDELRARAVAEEDNAAYPGSPTLTGWINVLIDEAVEMHYQVEKLIHPDGRPDP